MKLVGYVKGLRVSRGIEYWNTPNLYHCYGEDPEDVAIVMDDVAKELADFLINKSYHTEETISKDDISKFRIIGISMLRVLYCSEKVAVCDKNKEHKVPYIKYKVLDQLSTLINEIDMIAKFGRVDERDVYLKFFLQ